MGNPRIDERLYETIKPRLVAAMVAAGHSAQEWAEFWIEKIGDAEIPYLARFCQEIRDGRVKIAGLTESTRRAIFGGTVTPEQREAMIREAAYFCAQRRGFKGGSAEQDWREAAAEIDRLLAENAGLVGKGRQALSSLSDMTQKELEGIKGLVGNWIEHRQHPEH
jgi:hypothetical protein